jgi:hypothetical protein
MFELERSLLNEDVARWIVYKIDEFHKTFAKTKLNAFQWEDVLAQALVRAHGDHHVDYEGIGHQSGYDLVCNGIRISCKSGSEKNKKIKGNKIPVLTLSSYRLGTHKTWEDKIAFLKNRHEDSFFCLSSDQVECFGQVRCIYTLYVFPVEVVDIQNVEWHQHQTKTRIQPRGFGTNNTYYTIESSMSEQLWMHVPLELMWKVFTYETANIVSEQPAILPKEEGSFLCLNV